MRIFQKQMQIYSNKLMNKTSMKKEIQMKLKNGLQNIKSLKTMLTN